VIKTRNNSAEKKYIQSARLNGKIHKQFWFMHDELVRGGKLELELGPEPNRDWGTIEKAE
jgi:putative alpha-1,2-mannosidase